MTTTMASHQDLQHDRLQPPPEDPTIYHHHQQAWLSRDQVDNNEDREQTGFYRMPKRNKRKNFKPRCAPNSVAYNSDDSNPEMRTLEDENDPGSPDDHRMEVNTPESGFMRIGVKNFSLLKGSGAVDLSSGRFSTDSNENIEEQGMLNFMDASKRFDSRFQQSYINSLQGANDRTMLHSAKNFSAKNPFAISQLIKTNSPPRRRSDENSDDTDSDKPRHDINANDSNNDAADNNDDDIQNGAQPVANKMLREYAMNTMKELLGIYGLSSNEVNEALSTQARQMEAFQNVASLKRRYISPGDLVDAPVDRRPRRSPSVTTEEEQGSNNVTPSRSPERDENMYHDIQRQRALQFLSQQSMNRLLSARMQNEDHDTMEDRGSPGSNLEMDGDQTLDLSVSKDGDAQDLSTTSSAGNSVTEFDHQNMLMRRNMEDLASLQMQGMFQKPGSIMEHDDLLAESRAKLAQSSLLASLGHLEANRKIVPQQNVDYSRYVKRYASSLECGSSYCKDLGYREHFHCMDCTARVFCKKEEMIRHFKWHKKRDESLAHGFMRYSPLDDCSERYTDCPHNRSQTHYHCIQDGCDKVYISTSDVQMHANYHRKDTAILQEGFQRFRATETCSAPHCAFQGQRTTHFHCRRTGCTFTFKNKADMEKHKTYHIKDEQLARDGFKKYMKNEPCPYRDCRFSRACNHIHCIRPRCNYVLHSSSQLFSHKRKHERKEQELGYGLPSGILPNALLQQSPMDGVRVKPPSTPPTYSVDTDESSMSSLRNMVSGHQMNSGTHDFGGESMLQHHNLSQIVLDEVAKRFVEAFDGGSDSNDKCKRCSALNKHYHCIADGCSLAHSCHNTMLKHALEHEHQNQVTDAFFVTHSKMNPCNNSACQHIRDVTHYHCTWENCGCVILSSEDHPFKRLEHHRQHAILGPLSPKISSRMALAPNLASQLSQPSMAVLPPSLAQLAQIAPTLHSQLSMTSSPIGHPPNLNTSSSLDEMFSRKRGRPPKNRVVEVYTDNATPQAIFTSFKLPKNSLSPVPQQTIMNTSEEFSKIKFPNFDVYTVQDSCMSTILPCPFRSVRLHFHCAHCNYTVDNHSSLETHCREVHSIIQLLEGFEYYQSSEQCNGKACFKMLLKSHFHCIQSPNCASVLAQYSALATHKHGKMTPIKVPDMELSDLSNHPKFDQVKDYSIKREPTEGTGSIKAEAIVNIEGFPHGVMTIKSENSDSDAQGSNVSVVKATGTFYPSSHVSKSNPSTPSPSKVLEVSAQKPVPNLLPTLPPSCCDPQCSLNKKPGGIPTHYHCSFCGQAFVDTKLLYGHMVKKHGQFMDGNTSGLAATKETLEREYPEISILPSTASSSASSPVHLRQHQNQADQVQAVHNMLLQQYLSASSMQQVQKGLSLQDQLKYQQQLNASLASGIPGLTASQLAQMAFMSQSGSPFPLYPPMLYPPELLLEQGLLAAGGASSSLPMSTMDKDTAEMLAKKSHNVRTGPTMRLLKDEPIPEGYLRFRFNEDCAYQHCGYREHQTHFHCTRKDCGYSFCDKTRFVQHTARHERLDTLMGGDFQQYRANVFCGRQDCAHASNYGTGQNKASHFHCLKCDFVCTDTNKVVAHRRQHQKMDSIQAAGFEKFPPSKGCGFDPQCIHSRKQTHYHCLQCGFAVLGLSQMTSHKYRHQDNNQGAGTSGTS